MESFWQTAERIRLRDWGESQIERMITSVVMGVAVVLISIGLVWRMVFGSSTSAARSNTVEYGNPQKIFSIVFVLVAGAFVVGASYETGDDSVLAWIVTVFFWMCSLSLALESNFVKITDNDEFIRTHSPWRTSRVIPWLDVVGLKYSVMMRWYVLKTRESGKIRMHDYLSGAAPLIKKVKGKIYCLENGR